MTDDDTRAKTAWRCSVVAAALSVLGMLIEIAIIRSIPDMSVLPALASIAVAAVLLAVLVARARPPSIAVSNAAFLVNVGAIVAALWFVDRGFASSGRIWVPFQEHKLGMMTVALLAPELWVGVVSIAMYAGASLVQLMTLPAAGRHELALGEPWATLAFGVFSTILLAYRYKTTALEREVVVTRTSAEATRHLAKVLLAVRDLANTPLQTIAFATAEARELHPDLGTLMDRVERSLGVLRALDRRLRSYDGELTWAGREESLDVLTAAIPKASTRD
jgi:hypothetical protein